VVCCRVPAAVFNVLKKLYGVNVYGHTTCLSHVIRHRQLFRKRQKLSWDSW
jgi:hypothetical protein